MKLKEETIVAHDLLRLECKKLRDILNEKADQVRRRRSAVRVRER